MKESVFCSSAPWGGRGGGNSILPPHTPLKPLPPCASPNPISPLLSFHLQTNDTIISSSSIKTGFVGLLSCSMWPRWKIRPEGPLGAGVRVGAGQTQLLWSTAPPIPSSDLQPEFLSVPPWNSEASTGMTSTSN